MVIRWNELDPAGYEHTLTALADWITWLQTTYRIPAPSSHPAGTPTPATSKTSATSGPAGYSPATPTPASA